MAIATNTVQSLTSTLSTSSSSSNLTGNCSQAEDLISSVLTPIPAAAPTSTFSTNPTKRKRSMVWAYFSQAGDKEALCDVCAVKVPTGGNTTNMMKVKSLL